MVRLRNILTRVLAGAALWGAAAAGAMAATAAPPGAVTVEPVSPCFVTPMKSVAVDYKFDCGYVVVPESATAPAERRVKVGFLRLQARSKAAAAKASPLFMLAGGPGGTLIQPAVFGLFAPPMLGRVLDTRDVIILDQRGAAHTQPHLDCPEVYSLPYAAFRQRLNPGATAALQERVLQRCIEGFRRQGVDLAAYNSLAIAADVDAARRALGYQRIVLYGESFGSQIAQHVMRDFPGMLDAVILDGTNSLSRKSWVEDRALDIEFALGHLDALCREDAKCRQAYDVPSLVDRAIALFDAGPITASFADPAQPGRTSSLEVRRDDLLATIYALQGDKLGVASLPSFLEQAVRDGRPSMAQTLVPLLGQQLLAQRDATSGSMALVMHMAVVCSDDPVRSEDDLIVKGVRSRYALLMGQSFAQQTLALCAAIAVPELPPSTDVDVTVDVPTLILSGGLDVATPTFRSEVVAKALPRATMAVFPAGTHVQLGAINLCAGKIMTAFVQAPTAPLPLECVKESRFPGFVLPDGSMSR